MRKVVQQIPFGLPAYWRAMDAARQRMDFNLQKIAYGPAARQYLLILTPPGLTAGEPSPWLFYFHGGGWTFGRPERFIAAVAPWLARGYRVVMPSHRRLPLTSPEGIVADCRRAVRWVASRRVGSEWTGRYDLAGISSGGHLAAMLALRPPVATPARRVLLCAPPVSTSYLRPRLIFQRYRHLDPAELAREAVPPTTEWLLLHGSNDRIVPFDQSVRFAARVPRAQLLTISEGDHLDAGRWAFGHPGLDYVRERVARFLAEAE